jgi:four helix bundle protein
MTAFNPVNHQRGRLDHEIAHDLTVWRAAIALAKSTYDLTRSFPREEIYGLTAQMRRASVSIASNIAEGSARQGTKELIQFLYIATGSANELDTHAEIATAVGFMSDSEKEVFRNDVAKVLKMLGGSSVRQKQVPGISLSVSIRRQDRGPPFAG